jgi:hypothetical protein
MWEKQYETVMSSTNSKSTQRLEKVDSSDLMGVSQIYKPSIRNQTDQNSSFLQTTDMAVDISAPFSSTIGRPLTTSPQNSRRPTQSSSSTASKTSSSATHSREGQSRWELDEPVQRVVVLRLEEVLGSNDPSARALSLRALAALCPFLGPQHLSIHHRYEFTVILFSMFSLSSSLTALKIGDHIRPISTNYSPFCA